MQIRAKFVFILTSIKLLTAKNAHMVNARRPEFHKGAGGVTTASEAAAISVVDITN